MVQSSARKSIHRILSLALVLTLILAMMVFGSPMVSLATTVNVGTEATLRAAVSTTGEGDIVALSEGIGTLSTGLIIERDLTLDLNGYTLSIDIPATAGNTSNGIKINPNCTLIIKDGADGGNLSVANKASSVTNTVGIGCRAAINTTDGTLIIQSGRITATGGYFGAGIGGGLQNACGKIAISGGTVFATGGYGGAGIGSGANIDAGDKINISGGTVFATGGYGGAGIGGGIGGAGGVINISDGNVDSTGGNYGAGIGGGSGGAGGDIAVSGGEIKARGGGSIINVVGGGAGIGCGSSGAGASIIISGGTISADGGSYSAGVGGGYNSTGVGLYIHIKIISSSGVTVSATGGTGFANYGGGAGIGGGCSGGSGTVYIENGTVTATAGNVGNAAAIGRGSAGVNNRIIITGEYDYYVNTDNIAPEEISGTGAFDYDNKNGVSYRYIKLMSLNPPPFLSLVSSSRTSKDAATVKFSSTVAGTYYYIVLSGTESQPSAARIKLDSEGAVMETEENIVELQDLPNAEAFVIHIVGENSDDSSSNILSIDIDKYVGPQPVLARVSSTRTSSSSATVSFSSTLTGEFYYIVHGVTNATPSAATVKSSYVGTPRTMAQSNSNSITVGNLLSADAYNIHIVGESSEGTLSSVLTISIPKYEEKSDPPSVPRVTPTPTPPPPDEPESAGDNDTILPPHSSWAWEELERALELGLIPLSLLDPGIDLRRPISRIEFAGVAVKAYENLASTTVLPAVVNPFTDTQDMDALKTFNVGIMVGFSETIFSPYTNLTREQAATVLTRIFKRATMPGWSFETDANYPLTFTHPAPFADDKDISYWARESVYFMAANGIILGIGNNTFAPRAVTSVQQAAGYAIATREQSILLALRMVENIGFEKGQ